MSENWQNIWRRWTDGAGTTTYGHDALGRLTSRQADSGGGSLSYGYDEAGNLTVLI